MVPSRPTDWPGRCGSPQPCPHPSLLRAAVADRSRLAAPRFFLFLTAPLPHLHFCQRAQRVPLQRQVNTVADAAGACHIDRLADVPCQVGIRYLHNQTNVDIMPRECNNPLMLCQSRSASGTCAGSGTGGGTAGSQPLGASGGRAAKLPSPACLPRPPGRVAAAHERRATGAAPGHLGVAAHTLGARLGLQSGRASSCYIPCLEGPIGPGQGGLQGPQACLCLLAPALKALGQDPSCRTPFLLCPG